MEQERNSNNKNENKVLKMKLEARRNLIMQAMASGMSYFSMVNKFADEWGLSRRTVELAIQDTLKFIRSEETKQTLVDLNMARLDSIVEDSMKSGDRSSALKGIDLLNKAAGGYETKIKLESESSIVLDFGLGNDMPTTEDDKDEDEEE